MTYGIKSLMAHQYRLQKLLHKFEFDKIEFKSNFNTFIKQTIKPEITKFLSGHSTILMFFDPFLIEQSNINQYIKECIEEIVRKTNITQNIIENISEKEGDHKDKNGNQLTYISTFTYFNNLQKKDVQLHFIYVSIKDDIFDCWRLYKHENTRFPMNRILYNIGKQMNNGFRLFMITIIPIHNINQKEAEIIHDILGLFSKKKSSKTQVIEKNIENINSNKDKVTSKEKNENVLPKRKKFFFFF